MKVHLIGVRGRFSGWRARCGQAGIVRTSAVSFGVWLWLPESARCQSCRSYGVGSYVRDEHIAAVETALTLIARTMETWPDEWHCDPHGTGSNPHVWQHDDNHGRRICACGVTPGASDRETSTFS